VGKNVTFLFSILFQSQFCISNSIEKLVTSRFAFYSPGYLILCHGKNTSGGWPLATVLLSLTEAQNQTWLLGLY
jgi:hypothetical protein